MLNDLIELAKEEVPITLISLIRSFDSIYDVTEHYYQRPTFNEDKAGGRIDGYIDGEFVGVYFVPYDKTNRRTEECKSDDIVFITQIYGYSTGKYHFNNSEYCRIQR